MSTVSSTVGALACVALMVAGCGSDRQDPVSGDDVVEVPVEGRGAGDCERGEVDGHLHLYNRPDYVAPELIVSFETEYSVEVVEDFFESDEEMMAKLESGASYDLVLVRDHLVPEMIDRGLLVRLDRAAIANYRNLAPKFIDPVFDPGGEFTVAYLWGTTGLGVSTGLLEEGLEPSWSLVFDPDRVTGYASGVSLLDDPREALGAALKYLGYSLNTRSEDQLREAADLIASVDHLVRFSESVPNASALHEATVTVAHVRSGDLRDIDDDGGVQLSYAIPREGASMWVDSMAVPASAENPCTAHVFVDFILDPERGAALADWTRLASPNRAARSAIDPALLEDTTIYPSNEVLERLEVITDRDVLEDLYEEYFAIARS